MTLEPTATPSEIHHHLSGILTPEAHLAYQQNIGEHVLTSVITRSLMQTDGSNGISKVTDLIDRMSTYGPLPVALADIDSRAFFYDAPTRRDLRNATHLTNPGVFRVLQDIDVHIGRTIQNDPAAVSVALHIARNVYRDVRDMLRRERSNPGQFYPGQLFDRVRIADRLAHEALCDIKLLPRLPRPDGPEHPQIGPDYVNTLTTRDIETTVKGFTPADPPPATLVVLMAHIRKNRFGTASPVDRIYLGDLYQQWCDSYDKRAGYRDNDHWNTLREALQKYLTTPQEKQQ